VDVSSEVSVALPSTWLMGIDDTVSQKWDGSPPQGVALGEAFDVKVQVGPDSADDMPILIYDKSRTLETTVEADNCPQYKELFAVVHNFTPCAGRKAYFRSCVSPHRRSLCASGSVGASFRSSVIHNRPTCCTSMYFLQCLRCHPTEGSEYIPHRTPSLQTLLRVRLPRTKS
jgi:hypothetical protein